MLIYDNSFEFVVVIASTGFIAMPSHKRHIAVVWAYGSRLRGYLNAKIIRAGATSSREMGDPAWDASFQRSAVSVAG
jgi:hypothetical protein